MHHIAVDQYVIQRVHKCLTFTPFESKGIINVVNIATTRGLITSTIAVHIL